MFVVIEARRWGWNIISSSSASSWKPAPVVIVYTRLIFVVAHRHVRML
jgi:hypothetical protein